jgi:predicted nucleic acid-binding Zn ribbon protein
MERSRRRRDKSEARDANAVSGPVPIKDVLGEVLRGCGLSEGLDRLAVLRAWPRIVGGEIARHSQALALEDGVLTIDADHGAWRHELTLLLPMIVEKYNGEFGDGTVTEVRWNRRWTRRIEDANRQ